MLYGLEGLAALAGNLFLGVLWEEVSRVLSPGPKHVIITNCCM
jgi:hypothetical protein